MRAIIGPLVACIILFCGSLRAEVPKPMVDNVYRLTEAAAVLNICFESDEYKKLSDEKALQMHGLGIRITKIVEGISKHYNDDAILLIYELSKVKMSQNPEFKESIQKEYQYCGDRLFKEMDAYISENEIVFKDFLNRDIKRPSWQESAKSAYIDRCAESLNSQGLSKSTAHPYCACVAEGMEKEFGLEEYDQMIEAQPNPAGNKYDKRLFKVFEACGRYLPASSSTDRRK